MPSAPAVDTLKGWSCVEGGGGTVIEGATGSVVTGGVSIAVVCVELGQFAARWRIWKVSICSNEGGELGRV